MLPKKPPRVNAGGEIGIISILLYSYKMSNEKQAAVKAPCNLTCLVVDDSKVNLSMTLSFLLMCNIKAEAANSGAESLRMIEEKARTGLAYDLIFMDHMMPEMDGIETAKRIREWEIKTGQDKKIPIVALSGNTANGAEEMFLEAGMNGFVLKPIAAEELNRILRQLLPADKISETNLTEEEALCKDVDPLTKRLLEELAGIKGLDPKAGLANFGQNQDGYFLALRQFSENCDSYIKELTSAEKAEAWEDYSMAAHALKGVLAAFGAVRLFQWASNLEKASKKETGNSADSISQTSFSPELCCEETSPFCDALAKFRNMLSQTTLLDSVDTDKGDKPNGKEIFLREQIDNLRKACKGCSSGEIEKIFTTLYDFQWDSKTEANLENIRTLTSSYHFEEALEKIELIGLS